MLEGQEFKVSLSRAPGDPGSKNLRNKTRSGVRHPKSSTEGKMMGCLRQTLARVPQLSDLSPSLRVWVSMWVWPLAMAGND